MIWFMIVPQVVSFLEVVLERLLATWFRDCEASVQLRG